MQMSWLISNYPGPDMTAKTGGLGALELKGWAFSSVVVSEAAEAALPTTRPLRLGCWAEKRGASRAPNAKPRVLVIWNGNLSHYIIHYGVCSLMVTWDAPQPRRIAGRYSISRRKKQMCNTTIEHTHIAAGRRVVGGSGTGPLAHTKEMASHAHASSPLLLLHFFLFSLFSCCRLQHNARGEKFKCDALSKKAQTFYK